MYPTGARQLQGIAVPRLAGICRYTPRTSPSQNTRARARAPPPLAPRACSRTLVRSVPLPGRVAFPDAQIRSASTGNVKEVVASGTQYRTVRGGMYNPWIPSTPKPHTPLPLAAFKEDSAPVPTHPALRQLPEAVWVGSKPVYRPPALLPPPIPCVKARSRCGLFVQHACGEAGGEEGHGWHLLAPLDPPSSVCQPL